MSKLIDDPLFTPAKDKIKKIISNFKDYKYNLKFEWELGKTDTPRPKIICILSALWCFAQAIILFSVIIVFLIFIYYHRQLWGFN